MYWLVLAIIVLALFYFGAPPLSSGTALDTTPDKSFFALISFAFAAYFWDIAKEEDDHTNRVLYWPVLIVLLAVYTSHIFYLGSGV